MIHCIRILRSSFWIWTTSSGISDFYLGRWFCCRQKNFQHISISMGSWLSLRARGINCYTVILRAEWIDHHQSLFIHEIVSFCMAFLGIVFNTRLKYSKELLTVKLKMQKLTSVMNNKSYNGSWCIRIIFPMKWSLKNI